MDEVYWHKGHKIVLSPGVKDNGRWACQYLVIKFGNEQMGSRKDYPPTDSATKEEAMNAALNEAKALAESDAWQLRTIEYGPLDWTENEALHRQEWQEQGWEVVDVKSPVEEHVYEVTIRKIKKKQ